MCTTVAGVAVSSTRPSTAINVISVSPATARGWSSDIFVTVPINVVTPSRVGNAAVTVQARPPAPLLAATSTNTGDTGSTVEPRANAAEKRPSAAGRTGTPLTLTVAPGEAVPEMIIDSDHSNGLSEGEESSKPMLGTVNTGGGFPGFSIRAGKGGSVGLGVAVSGAKVAWGLEPGAGTGGMPANGVDEVGGPASAVDAADAAAAGRKAVSGALTAVSGPQPAKAHGVTEANTRDQRAQRLIGVRQYPMVDRTLNPASRHSGYSRYCPALLPKRWS